MTKKDIKEKRKHKRFKVKEGVLAASSPDYDRLGQIKDVSKGGLAFQYLKNIRSNKEPLEIEIFSPFDHFHLEKLPVRTVMDFKLDSKGLYTSLPIRQLSLQFGKLNHSQDLLLDNFIQRYTQK